MSRPLTTIGVESAYGFGDCVFNAPLIKALSEKNGCKIDVAVTARCQDAFFNLPWINELLVIEKRDQGCDEFRRRGYHQIHQISQSAKFPIYSKIDKEHSLIDTPLWNGRRMGLENFDQRPIFIPTAKESAAVNRLPTRRPLIAVESVFLSRQSWANQQAFDYIINKTSNSYNILWLSNQGAPSHPAVMDCLDFTRRELICCLSRCDYFFSVGSGFFCASLALDQQPKQTICMWINKWTRYEKRMSQLNLDTNIIWVHNHAELQAAVEGHP